MDPILVREAEAHGLTPKMLYGRQWTRPADGVAVPRGATDDLAMRSRAVLAVLPDDAVVTHLTSASLRGWWLPSHLAIPVIACTDGEAPHLDRRGVYVRRCAIPRQHREELDGVAIASSAWTLAELAEDLALIDLVVAVDAALHAGDTTVAEIRAAMVKGRRGVRVLRRSVDLCDARSESPWETILRLMHQMSGIPVEPQHPIVNEQGTVVARGDLLIKGTRRLAEYDGADHRSRDQHERDLRRDKLLARLGYERYGYIAREVVREPGRIMRDAERARGLEHDPARLRWWLDAVRESTLHPAGIERLRRRLRRFDRRTSPRTSRVAQTGVRVAQV